MRYSDLLEAGKHSLFAGSVRRMKYGLRSTIGWPSRQEAHPDAPPLPNHPFDLLDRPLPMTAAPSRRGRGVRRNGGSRTT